MKQFLKYSGLCALAVAVVGFILMLVTPSVVYTTTATVLGNTSTSVTYISGIAGIFGTGTAVTDGNVSDFDGTAVWSAILAFILIIVALLILIFGFVFPFLKIKALDKFAGVLNLAATVLLVAAGIFLFFEVPAFQAANEVSNSSGALGSWASASGSYGLGVGWVFAAILTIAGGVLAILPAAFDFLGKKK